MGTGGTLIRLIDVVFILLFGFISISEVSQKSKIELPTSAETPPSNPDTEHVLFVGINSEGHYLIADESRALRTPRDLYSYLREEVSAAIKSGDDLRVRIRSNWDTPIKFAMAAADICDNLNIQKGIDVRRVALSQ